MKNNLYKTAKKYDIFYTFFILMCILSIPLGIWLFFKGHLKYGIIIFVFCLIMQDYFKKKLNKEITISVQPYISSEEKRFLGDYQVITDSKYINKFIDDVKNTRHWKSYDYDPILTDPDNSYQDGKYTVEESISHCFADVKKISAGNYKGMKYTLSDLRIWHGKDVTVSHEEYNWGNDTYEEVSHKDNYTYTDFYGTWIIIDSFIARDHIINESRLRKINEVNPDLHAEAEIKNNQLHIMTNDLQLFNYFELDEFGAIKTDSIKDITEFQKRVTSEIELAEKYIHSIYDTFF